MFQEIHENVFALISKTHSSNVFLIKGKENILIDAGLEANVEFLKVQLKEIGLFPKDISTILFTHGHADHIGGAVLFKNAKMFMSEYDGKLVNLKDDDFTVASAFNQKFFPIVNFFSKNQVFKVNDFELKIIETPGHTKGGVCFFDEKKKILFSGDTLFNGTVGRSDLISSNKKELIESIEKLKKIDFDLLLTGHGKILNSNQKENLNFALELLK